MIESALRERHVLELRIAGWSFEAIGEEVGYSDRSAAYKAFRRALEHNAKEPTEEALDLHLAQLDDLYRSLYPKRDDAKIAAVMVRILTERAKALGLFKPQGQPVDYQQLPVVPLTAEQSLAAAESLQRSIAEVAAKHADTIIAERATNNAPPQLPSGPHPESQTAIVLDGEGGEGLSERGAG